MDWGVINSVKVEVFSILNSWVTVVLAYYYSFKVPSIIYTLINFNSISLYLFLANLIISLFYLVWSFFCAILCKD